MILTTAGSSNVERYMINQTTYSISLLHLFTFYPQPSSLFISQDKMWTLTIDTTNSQSILKLNNQTVGSLINHIILPINYTKMEVDSTYSKIVVWTDSGELMLFDANTLNTISSWTTPVNLSNTTVSIIFNQAGTLLIY